MSLPPDAIELLSRSAEQTRRLGETLAGRLAGGDVVALTGPLGAGKTQWVKGLAAGLGIDPDEVHSPTFTLINEYDSRRDGAPRLYHVDVYRLAGPPELETLGFAEILDARDGVIAVEWADRVPALLPADAVWIEGSIPSSKDPNERRYSVRVTRAGLLDVLDNSFNQ